MKGPAKVFWFYECNFVI